MNVINNFGINVGQLNLENKLLKNKMLALEKENTILKKHFDSVK